MLLTRFVCHANAISIGIFIYESHKVLNEANKTIAIKINKFRNGFSTVGYTQYFIYISYKYIVPNLTKQQKSLIHTHTHPFA